MPGKLHHRVAQHRASTHDPTMGPSRTHLVPCPPLLPSASASLPEKAPILPASPWKGLRFTSGSTPAAPAPAATPDAALLARASAVAAASSCVHRKLLLRALSAALLLWIRSPAPSCTLDGPEPGMGPRGRPPGAVAAKLPPLPTGAAPGAAAANGDGVARPSRSAALRAASLCSRLNEDITIRAVMSGDRGPCGSPEPPEPTEAPDPPWRPAAGPWTAKLASWAAMLRERVSSAWLRPPGSACESAPAG
jgi:hypothetical protein